MHMCSNTCRSCQTRQTAQQWGGGKINGVTCGPLDKLGCDSCRVKFVEVNEVRHGKVTCTCAQKRANQAKHVQKRAHVHVLDFCTYARMHVPRRKPRCTGGCEICLRFLLLDSLLDGGPREWWSRYIGSHLSGRLCGQSVIV